MRKIIEEIAVNVDVLDKVMSKPGEVHKMHVDESSDSDMSIQSAANS